MNKWSESMKEWNQRKNEIKEINEINEMNEMSYWMKCMN